MKGIMRNVLNLLAVCISALSLVQSETLQNKQPVSIRCHQRISTPERYRLFSGSSCYLHIRSPPKTRVKLTVETASCPGPDHSVVFVDGMVVRYPGNRNILVPKHSDVAEQRNVIWCPPPNQQFLTAQRFESSQNTAELVYQLNADDIVTINVEFVESDSMCDNVLEEPGTYEMTSSGVCRMYLPGGIRLKVEDLVLNTNGASENCQDPSGAHVGIFTGDFGNMKNYKNLCEPVDAGKKQYLLTCKHSMIELRAGHDGTEASVKFSFNFNVSFLDELLNECQD